jgi:hypothetical protein
MAGIRGSSSGKVAVFTSLAVDVDRLDRSSGVQHIADILPLVLAKYAIHETQPIPRVECRPQTWCLPSAFRHEIFGSPLFRGGGPFSFSRLLVRFPWRRFLPGNSRRARRRSLRESSPSLKAKYRRGNCQRERHDCLAHLLTLFHNGSSGWARAIRWWKTASGKRALAWA